MKKSDENISDFRESEAPCRSCYYQEVSFLGRLCQHKRSMEGTEVEAEYDFCNEIKSCNYYTADDEEPNCNMCCHCDGNDVVGRSHI